MKMYLKLQLQVPSQDLTNHENKHNVHECLIKHSCTKRCAPLSKVLPLGSSQSLFFFVLNHFVLHPRRIASPNQQQENLKKKKLN